MSALRLQLSLQRRQPLLATLPQPHARLLRRLPLLARCTDERRPFLRRRALDIGQLGCGGGASRASEIERRSQLSQLGLCSGARGACRRLGRLGLRQLQLDSRQISVGGSGALCRVRLRGGLCGCLLGGQRLLHRCDAALVIRDQSGARRSGHRRPDLAVDHRRDELGLQRRPCLRSLRVSRFTLRPRSAGSVSHGLLPRSDCALVGGRHHRPCLNLLRGPLLGCLLCRLPHHICPRQPDGQSGGELRVRVLRIGHLFLVKVDQCEVGLCLGQC